MLVGQVIRIFAFSAGLGVDADVKGNAVLASLSFDAELVVRILERTCSVGTAERVLQRISPNSWKLE